MRHRVAPISCDLVLEIAAGLADRVPGNIVEFGVFKGGSTRVLRQAVDQLQRGQLLGAKKEIFACDSFRGFPEKYESLAIERSLVPHPPFPVFTSSWATSKARSHPNSPSVSDVWRRFRSMPTSTPRRSARFGG